VTAADVRALRAKLDPAIAIKAAGGIRTRAQAEELVAAGADRLGTSRAAELLAARDGGAARGWPGPLRPIVT
jgi:deoxyribose-phosphate aldolase